MFPLSPDAKSVPVLLLGHTTSGMGEKSLASKLKTLMNQSGFRVGSTIDLFDLMGELYEPLAKLNYDLASNETQLIEDVQLKGAQKIKEVLAASDADIFLILSWCWSVAALFAVGVHRLRPTAVKFFVHHSNEKVVHSLYEPANLLITESLLANERGEAFGIPAGKMLYLPHHYPLQCEQILSSRRYVERLARLQGKTISPETVVIGTVSRLEYGKNCEFALEAVRELAQKGRKVVLVLKGDFSKESSHPDYYPLFSTMLATYQDEPWFLWDRETTSFPDVLHEYASFDLCLHLSGAEGGSHVVVEFLGLGKPVLLLDASTNPSLFKGAALFVRSTGKMRAGPLPFHVPDREDLMEKLEALVLDANYRSLKGREGHLLARQRFHPKVTQDRLGLLYEATRDPKSFYKQIEALNAQDRQLYE